MTIRLTDRDMLEDYLVTEKHLTDVYNTSANEADDDDLRSTLLNILLEEHQLVSATFSQMDSRGWYQVKNADIKDITRVKKQFEDSRTEFRGA